MNLKITKKFKRAKRFYETFKSFAFDKSPDTELILTTRCNSRCNICNYWKQKKIDMPFWMVKEVLDAKHTFLGFGLSGGEAILHPKIEEIIELAKNHKDFKSFSLLTNGLATNRIVELVKKYEMPRINISLDAIDSKSYKKVRGVNGVKDVIDTIKRLKDETSAELSLMFTISFQTRQDLIDVLKFADSLDIGVFVAPYNDRDRLSTKKSFKLFEYKDLVDSYLLRGWEEWSRGVRIPCRSVRIYAEVLPNGNVYFCPNSKNSEPDGNLNNNSFDDVWESSRDRIKKLKDCSKCFISCNRAKDYWLYSHPIIAKIIDWI